MRADGLIAGPTTPEDRRSWASRARVDRHAGDEVMIESLSAPPSAHARASATMSDSAST
jgi:hypothetical protein